MGVLVAVSPWAQLEQQNLQPPPDMPPPVFAPSSMSSPMPDLSSAPIAKVRPPTAGEDQISNDQQALQHVRWQQHSPWGTDPTYDANGTMTDPGNHPGKLGKVAHAFATLGNIAGDIFAPSLAARIPGSQLNMEAKEGTLANRLNTEITDESQNQERGAQQAHLQEETDEAPEKATDAHNQSVATAGNLDSETTARNAASAQGPSLAVAYSHAVQESLKRNEDPSQNPVVQHLQDAITGLQKQPNTPPGTKMVQLEVNGKPHQVLVDERSGQTVKDLGESGEKPPQIHVDTGQHAFQETERGRGLLDKAEGAYRTAQQGANTMRDMVASASAGNKMSAQVLPLEGALAITTAQGVHRINRTEVDQYAGAGNLYDKIAGEAGKLTAGQPIPKNILSDIEKLTNIQEKGAYQTYRAAHDSAVKRYNLQGEDALPEPGGGAQNPQGIPPGYVYNAHGPKGAGYYAPTAK